MNPSEGRAGAGALYGTLEVMILKTLADGGPLHGLQIADRIRARSDELLRIEEGALYPALHRLKRLGFVEGEWRISNKRRRARFYDLTPLGQQALFAELDAWQRHSAAVNKVLGLEQTSL
jgi:PadR family transcriptional regulator